jgi:hypothetical protein
MDMQLIRRAVVLFPRTDYTDMQQVRHARRQWLRSVVALRSSGKSKWILDNRVERLQ